MRRRVLLIDDSVTIHKIVELTIDRQIFEMHGAYDMENGIRTAGETGADIILVDNKLCTGEDCMTKLRAAAPDASIVMLVGAYDQFLDTDVKHLDVQDYLVKPFNSTTLNQALTDAIAQEEEPPTETPPAQEPEISGPPAEEPPMLTEEPVNEEALPMPEEPDGSPMELIEQDIELEMLENHLQNMDEDEDTLEDDTADEEEEEDTPLPESADEETPMEDVLTENPEEIEIPADEEPGQEELLMLTEEPTPAEALPELVAEEPQEIPEEEAPPEETEQELPEEPESTEIAEDFTPASMEEEQEEEVEAAIEETAPGESLEQEDIDKIHDLLVGNSTEEANREKLYEEPQALEEPESSLDAEGQNQLLDDLYTLLTDKQQVLDMEGTDKLFGQEINERQEIMGMFEDIRDSLDDITAELEEPPMPVEPKTPRSGFMRIAELNRVAPKSEGIGRLTIELSADELSDILKKYLDSAALESIVGEAMQKAVDRMIPDLVEKLVREELKIIKGK